MTGPQIKLLSETDIEKKFKTLIELKQLKKEMKEATKKGLTPEQVLEQEVMRKTVYRTELVDAAREVIGKSRRSVEAFY